jgi:hypothetical protein
MSEPAAVAITIDNFESAAIPLSQFNHRAHVTVAYLYIRRHGLEGALERMRAGIHAYNAAHKVPVSPTGGYHETVTVAWMRLIAGAINAYGPGADAAGFFEEHPYLLCRTLLRVFYSRERIMSAEAKAGFVEADLARLPG